MNLSREILHHRHRLSHQQIDQLLGEQKSGEYLAEKLAQMEQLREFFRITDALAEAGVDFLCLKGPLLSQRIYGDPTFRQYNDFDLLVRPGDLETVIPLMTAMGYTTPDLSIPRDPSRRRFLFRKMNEIMFWQPDENLGVEIHWRLVAGYIMTPERMENLVWENLGEISFSGRNFQVLTPELDLLYVCIHGGLHAYRRLKWLVDVKDFLERLDYDEARFLDLTGQWKASRLMALTNALLGHFFPGSPLLPLHKVPRKALLRFSLKEIHTPTDRETKSLRVYFRRLRFALGAFPGWRYKLSVIQSHLLATDALGSKFLPPNPLLHYLIGPFWKLFRGFR